MPNTIAESSVIPRIITSTYIPTNVTPGTRIYRNGIYLTTGTATTINWWNAFSSTSTSTSLELSNAYIRYDNNSFITVVYDNNGTAINTHIYRCPEYKPTKINHRLLKSKRNFAKKALWKSIRTFESLFGINNIQLFLNGEGFEIEGRKFNYKISKKSYANLLSHTQNPNSHIIPYNLEIFNKQGLFLFSGCTIFKNTPIIDQITALLLYIQNGEEEDLIKNMNLSRLTDDFFKDINSIEIINSIKNTKYEPKIIL